MTTAEQSFAASLPRNFTSPQNQKNEQWINAFEQAFPDVVPVTNEFRDTYRDSIQQFNNDFSNNLALWSKRIATAGAGVDEDAAEWYFLTIWNDMTTSGSGEATHDYIAFWRDVDEALETGKIREADPRDYYPTAPHEVSDSRLENVIASMPEDQREKLLDAHASSPEVIGSEQVARFRDAFKQARETCANGGGQVALPTDGNGRNVPTNPTSPYTVPPTQNGQQKPAVTPENDADESAAPTTTKKSTINVNLSTTIKRERKPSEPAGSSMSTGAIVGIVVTLLVLIGGAGAAFVMGAQ